MVVGQNFGVASPVDEGFDLPLCFLLREFQFQRRLHYVPIKLLFTGWRSMVVNHCKMGSRRMLNQPARRALHQAS